MSGTVHHLPKMKRRLEPNPPEAAAAATPMSPTEKIELLENTLSTFRNEVDMKLKIVQQILTTRNEQVSVQKKLLDREQKLYTALLAHWLNTPHLAAFGISMNVSGDTTENENLENELDQDLDYETIQETHDADSRIELPGPPTKATVKPSKKSRRKRVKVAKLDSDGPNNPADGEVKAEFVDVDPRNVLENMSDDGDGDVDEHWGHPMGASESEDMTTTVEHNTNDGNEIDQGKSKTHAYACQVCLKTYSCRKSLWRHSKFECMATTNNPNFCCSLCPATAKRRDNFLKHLKRIHKIQADKSTCLNYTRSPDDDDQTSLQYLAEDMDSNLEAPSPGNPVISDEENDPGSPETSG